MKPNRTLKTFMRAAVGIGVALSFAPHVRAQEIRATETRPDRALLRSGAFALAVPYVSSVIVAAESNHPGDGALYVPVAGPWMDLSDRHCAVGERCNHEGLYKGLLIADGIFQGIGAVEIVAAFLSPETVTTREVVSGAGTRGLTAAALRVTPVFSGSSLGIATMGSF